MWKSFLIPIDQPTSSALFQLYRNTPMLKWPVLLKETDYNEGNPDNIIVCVIFSFCDKQYLAI